MKEYKGITFNSYEVQQCYINYIEPLIKEIQILQNPYYYHMEIMKKNEQATKEAK